MAGIRMTGLASGMDTQALISQLSEAYQKKVDNTKKAQTKAEWKKTAWSSLNKKLQDFYKGPLATFKTAGTYNAKAVNGTLSGIKITASNKAVNGTHKVQVKSTASAQMWTGKKLPSKVTSTSYEAASGEKELIDLKDSEGNSLYNLINGSSFTVNAGGVSTTINIDTSKIKSGGSYVDDDLDDDVDFDFSDDEVYDLDITTGDLVDNINSQLRAAGSDVTASFVDGKLTFSNAGDEAVTITADNSASAKALGISESGMSVDSGASASGATFAYVEKITEGDDVTSSTKISDLMGDKWTGSTTLTVNNKSVTIDQNTTLNDLAKAMEGTGINASYDANQGRFYLSSKGTGSENAFDVTGNSEVIKALGLNLSDSDPAKIKATDAQITYNGVTYTSSSNTFNINGLTFEATAKGDEMTFSVDNDVEGIYKKVKDFLKEYNSLLLEMNTYYNADSSRGYEPLTADEREALSEDEAKDYEKKIKDSLLRRDDNLNNLISNFRSNMSKTVNIDGVGYSLSSFGINTGDWAERGLLHLDGDPDDATVMGNTDKLKAAIINNPEAVMKTLSELGGGLYDYMMKAQRGNTNRTALNFYDDKAMDSDIKSKKDDVTKMQEKMQAEEDKYYKQFSAMETAMAKLQSQQSYLSGLFGG